MPKQLVLVGGGHAHLTMLARCRDYVDRGFRVTLISASSYHYYSGMGPGLLAGVYRPQDVRFHVGKMVADRGAQFIEDRLMRVDAVRRLLHLRSGRTVAYDVVSFNIGSDVALPPVSNGCDRVFPVKPIVSLLAARRAIIKLLGEGRPEIVVIGGGPAGLEIAGNVWRLVRDQAGQAHITVIPGRELLSGYTRRVQDLARRSLLRRGIAVRDGRYAGRIEKEEIVLDNGEAQKADIVLVATGIRPSPLFRDSGLPVGPDGGLLVNRFLQSTTHPELFGGGDAICFGPLSLPKVGVYAVRQNMILYRNTLASLEGTGLVPFEPQRDFLLIFNLGDGRAIMTKRGLACEGRLAWRLKDRIDRSFMKKFQVSGERSAPDEEEPHGHS